MVVKYNLGCGTTILDGYINIDKAKYLKDEDGKEVDYVRANILTYDYEMADEFFLDNVIEHLEFKIVIRLLETLKKKLKPNGTIFIIVPDFESVTKCIIELPPDALFNFNIWARNCLLGTQVHDEDYHRSFYTQPLLKYICESCGFKTKGLYKLPYSKHGGYHLRIILERYDVQGK